MSEYQLSVFCELLMCSDPWPLTEGHGVMTEFADEQSREHGYTDWIDAYHRINPEKAKSAALSVEN